MAQFDHCFDGAAAAAGWDRQAPDTDRKLATALRNVHTRAQEYIDQGMNPRDATLQAGKDAAEAARTAATIERRNQLLNLSKRVVQTGRATARTEALAARGSADPIHDALHSMLDGSSTITPEGGERASTAARQHANASVTQAGYEYDLSEAKLLRAARGAKGGFARNIYRELYELSMKDSGQDAQVGHTGDNNALKIAQIARKYQVQSRANLNAEGADIGDVAGYMGTTIHGADPIYKAGFDTWSRDLLAGLDPRTFAGLGAQDRDRYLKKLFADFTTGRHMDDGQGVGYADPDFSGPGNLAKRLSQSRVLHWKNADAWLDYQDKYSQGSFQEKMVNSLRNGARQHSLLLDWGTNPRAEFQNLIERTLDHFQKAGQLDVVRKFTPTHKNSLMQLFGDMDGANSIPLRAMAAKVATYARNIVSMADLGGVLFRHASAFATIPAELRYQGVPYLQALRSVLTNFLGPFQGEERRRVASLIGAGVESMHGAALGAGVGASDSLPGVGDRLLNTYVRLTGLSGALRAQKEGVGLMLAHELALEKGAAFADLSPARRSIFARYSITEPDWDALRAAPDNPTANGREYLTPDAATRSPAALSDRERTALGLKLRAYYVDSADRALITPTATDRNLARFALNRDPNTLGGQVGRFLAQFHTWPIAAARQGLGREWNGRVGMGSRVGGLLSLMGTATAAAYVGDTINGLLQGEEPAPITPETFAHSFVRGGATGLVGDYLAAAARDGAAGVVHEAAGPVATQQAMPLAQLIADGWHAARNGDGSKFGSAMAQFVGHNIPLGNLFYLRGALHYLFLDSLQETMDPGYLERHNAYMREQEGVSYLSPHPAVHLPTFGR